MININIYKQFCCCSCPYLARNVSVLIPIIGGVLFLFTMSALLRTSLTDPGIIPRATQDEAAYVEQQIGIFLINKII